MSELDRLKSALAALLVPLQRRVDYSALYEAEVVSQNDDGSLELKPLTERLPAMSRVTIRYGVPGVSVRVNPGAQALVGFRNTDPSKPFAMIVDDASIASLALFGGTRPLARMGDAVNVFFPKAVPVSGIVTGMPFTGVATILQPAPGQIATGNPKVTA